MHRTPCTPQPLSLSYLPPCTQTQARGGSKRRAAAAAAEGAAGEAEGAEEEEAEVGRAAVFGSAAA